jgi:hypothetical protein
VAAIGNKRSGQRRTSGVPGVVAGRLAGGFRQLKPLCSHLSEDGARLAIGRNLRQLQAMGGEVDVLLSFVD